MPDVNLPFPEEGKNDKETMDNVIDVVIKLRKELEFLLQNLNEDNLPDYTGINGWKMFNGKGINPRFIKAFPNKPRNTSFEVFDSATMKPDYWSGGVSSAEAAFDGTYSMKLTAGQNSRTTGYTLNPQWWITVTGGKDNITKTRVSFYQKHGSVKVEVLDVSNSDTPLELTGEDKTKGTSITYPSVDNWGPASLRTVTFEHGTSTNISIKFTNMEASDPCYIDAIICEPDFTGEWSSFYTHGPNSISNSKGKDITTTNPIYVQDDEPTDAVEDDVWIDTNDYSRYDTSSITGVTTLTADGNEVVFASGTFTITLHSGTSSGIIKKVHNTGSGMITIAGTINGITNMLLYPNESVELITDGTNWRY